MIKESSMTRLKFPEIVVMVLALLGGFGILFFLGAGLIYATFARSAETGGGVFVVSGGISRRLFAFLVFVVVALIVATAVALWQRRKPGRDKRSA